MSVDLLALVEEDGFRAVQKAHSRGGQYNGPCPFCGGRDRFRVQPHHGPYGWFACNQCGRKGSAIDYLMLKRGLAKQEALTLAGWTPQDGSAPAFALPSYAYDERPRWNEPPEAWQEGARAFYQHCQHLLWSDAGREALAYLRRRGLTDKTIKAALLGYHPKEAYGPVQEWGRPVKLPPGIIIPWCFQGKVWRLTVRNERVAEGEGRYSQIAGGSNGLYLADSLPLGRPAAVLVEGELDALSLAQECGDLVAVVATGTTQGSHTPRWVSLLARQPIALVAFDAEETGDRAARWWLARLENARRLRPWWKDANQMLQDGADLRQWISAALSDVEPRREASAVAPLQVTAPPQHKQEQRAPAPSNRAQDDQDETSTPRKIGTCLVPSYQTGRPCGSTRWWFSKTEEYVCARCLSPIAWSRHIRSEQQTGAR